MTEIPYNASATATVNVNGNCYGATNDPLVIEGVPDSSGVLPVFDASTALPTGSWQQVAGLNNNVYSTSVTFGGNSVTGLVYENSTAVATGDPAAGDAAMLTEASLPSELQPGQMCYNIAGTEFENLRGMTSQATSSQLPNAGGSAWTQAVSGTGLAGWWQLDDGYETTGSVPTTVADSSGNNLANGTLEGTATSSNWIAGKIDGALSLNGTNNYVNVPSDAAFGTGAFTISAWVKPTGLTSSSNYSIVGDYTSSSQYYEFALTGTTGLSLFINSATKLTATVPSWGSSWSLVTVTRNANGNVTFYVNGVAYAGSIALTGNPGHTQTILGASGGSTPYYFKGGLDNVLLYARALQAGEVAALYNLAPIMTANGSLDFGSESVYANGTTGSAADKTYLGLDVALGGAWGGPLPIQSPGPRHDDRLGRRHGPVRSERRHLERLDRADRPGSDLDQRSNGPVGHRLDGQRLYGGPDAFGPLRVGPDAKHLVGHYPAIWLEPSGVRVRHVELGRRVQRRLGRQQRIQEQRAEFQLSLELFWREHNQFRDAAGRFSQPPSSGAGELSSQFSLLPADSARSSTTRST